MLFMEIFAVCCIIIRTHTYTQQNAEFLHVKSGGINNNQCHFKQLTQVHVKMEYICGREEIEFIKWSMTLQCDGMVTSAVE